MFQYLIMKNVVFVGIFMFCLPVEDPNPEPTTDIPAKPGPEKLPKPVLEKSSKPATTEQAPNPATVDRPTTKPTTAAPATDKVSKQGAEKVSKSPPPPPPRKTFPSPLLSGMTTTRSGEVVYTSRKESISAQVSANGRVVRGWNHVCG